jgi:hypothetical protein
VTPNKNKFKGFKFFFNLKNFQKKFPKFPKKNRNFRKKIQKFPKKIQKFPKKIKFFFLSDEPQIEPIKLQRDLWSLMKMSSPAMAPAKKGQSVRRMSSPKE